ncbi:MAG: hypothetical protein U5K37_03500 [Natrialbaceae archaeon]|nr:hypothetical protein [Natrialbaceae archaeon]
MPRDSPRTNRTAPATDQTNLVTIIGQGIPSSYEITVDGEIEPLSEGHELDRVTVSGAAAEGSIDVGVQRFRFSGELTAVTFVGRGSRDSPGSPYVPRISIDYNVVE